MPKNLRPWLSMIAEDGAGGGSGAEAQHPAPDGQSDQGEREATTEAPGKGFPDGVPVAEMSDAEQAAYWRHHARRWQDRAKEKGDYSQLKKDSAELARIRAEQLSDHDKALVAAREEGRNGALAEANEGAARAILTATMRHRGLSEEDVTEAMRPLSMAAFIADGAVDHDALLAYADRLAGPLKQQTEPDMGQGRRGPAQTTLTGEQLLEKYNL